MNLKNDDKNIINVLQKKNIFFKDVIQKTIIHVQQNKKLDILGVSDVSLCIDNLYEIVRKINKLEDNLDFTNEESNCKNTENYINELQIINNELSLKCYRRFDNFYKFYTKITKYLEEFEMLLLTMYQLFQILFLTMIF